MRKLTSSLLYSLVLLPVFVAADWHANIDWVSGQSFGFGTGAESGASIKVEIYDRCRVETATRSYVGDLYPSPTAYGMNVDSSYVVSDPGDGNSIAFTFAEGIAENTNIYRDNGDNTATVEFCAQTGVYYSGTLVNFAEVKLTYIIDLVTQISSLTGYTVTQSEEFIDASDTNIGFDGTLFAYFCDPYSFDELPNDGLISHQGSIINICFKVPDGNFEVTDIVDLTVENAINAVPSQTLIFGTTIQSPTYTDKVCHDNDVGDTNVCVVSFLLTADFYDYQYITLTGSGTVLLEFGDATGSRRQLKHTPGHSRQLKSRVKGFILKAKEFVAKPVVPVVTKKQEGFFSKGPVAIVPIIVVGALCAFVLAKKAVTARTRYQSSKLDDMLHSTNRSSRVIDFQWNEDFTSRSENVRRCNPEKEQVEEETVFFDHGDEERQSEVFQCRDVDTYKSEGTQACRPCEQLFLEGEPISNSCNVDIRNDCYLENEQQDPSLLGSEAASCHESEGSLDVCENEDEDGHMYAMGLRASF